MHLNRKLGSSLLLALGMLPLTTQAANRCDQVDRLGREPDWYASQCLGITQTPVRPATDGTASRALDVSPMAYALNLNETGPVPDSFVEHPLDDFAAYNLLTLFDPPVRKYGFFSLESSLDGSTVYGIDTFTNRLASIDPATGVVTFIGSSTPQSGHTFTGIAISLSGAFAVSTDTTTSTLYSLNLNTGATTVIGSQNTAPALIDMAMTCAGKLYGHDIATDSMYAIDPATGGVTLLGATGIDADFAQGMTIDRDSDTIYAYGYTGGGQNTYGPVDLDSGAIIPASVSNPLGQWVGATTTNCPTVRQLDVTTSGGGSVTSTPNGIDCGSSCSASFDTGSNVELTAVLPAEWTEGVWTWNGACSGNAGCIVEMNIDKVVDASFQCKLISIPQPLTPIDSALPAWECFDLEAIEGFEIAGPNGDVRFIAQNSIRLGGGFRVGDGAMFSAQIIP